MLRNACVQMERFEVRLMLSASAPTITAPPPPPASGAYENIPTILSAGNGDAITVADAAAGNNPDTLSITLTHGTLNLGVSAGLTFTTGTPSGSSAISFTGTISQINAALSNVEFVPTPNFQGPATLALSVSDPHDGQSASINDNINIQPPPAPTIAVPGPVNGYQNTPTVFSSANGDAISLTDIEAGYNGYSETLTLTAANGTISLDSTQGLTFSTGSGSGSSSIVVTGSLTNINNALNGMAFVPTAGFHGGAPIQLSVTDNGDALTGNGNANVNVQPPGPPTITCAGPANGYENTPLILSAGNGNGITLSDPEAGAGSDTVTLTVTNGSLNLASSTGLSFTAGSMSGSSTLTFSGSVANINSAINGMEFIPTAGFHGGAPLQISVSDPADSQTGNANVNLNIQPPAPPTITPGGPINGYVNTPLILSAGYGDQVSISDPEAQANSTSDSVTMSAANGTMVFPSTAGVTFTTGSPSGSTSVQFGGTLSAINAMLNGMEFIPTAAFQGPAPIQISVSDPADAQTGTGNVNINIQPAAAPTITVPGPTNGYENTPFIFSAANNSALSVSDPEASANSDSITLAVSDGTLDLATSAGLTFTTGSASGSSTITFTGSLPNINNALNGMEFVPTASYTGNAPLAITVNDAADAPSATKNLNINVQAQTRPPTVAVAAPQSTAENTTLVLSQANGNLIALGDSQTTPDTVTLVATNGTLTLASTTGVTVQTAGPATWVFSAPIATLQTAMNGVKFTPTSGYTGPASITATIESTAPGQTLSASATLPMYVGAAAAAPAVNVPATQVTAQNSPITFSTAAGNAIWISDIGNTGGPEQVTLTASLGNISLSQTTGLSFTVGAGSNDNSMTFTGTLAEINAALNGLIYTPRPGSLGADAIQITVNDLGNTVSGVPQAGNASAAIAINNAAPTVAIAPSASPNIVTGTTAVLSVLGADDGGESNLTYTWSQTNSQGAAVTFSANGTNSAKNTVATFQQSGTYYFTVAITDAEGLTTTSAMTVLVSLNSAASSAGLSVTVPGTQQTTANSPLEFSSAGNNSVEVATTAGGPITVTLTSSNGTLTLSSTNGLNFTTGNGIGDSTMTFNAPNVSSITAALNGMEFTPSTNYTGWAGLSISATQGPTTASQSVSINVASLNQPPTVAQAAAASPNPVTGVSTALTVLGTDDTGESGLTYSWSVLSAPAGVSGPSFSLNGSNAAKNTTATFNQAGAYELEVTIIDPGGLSVTSQIAVQVNQTITSIVVSPGSSSVLSGGSEQFTAVALDQFGQPLATQPAFTWTTTTSGGSGSNGSIGLLGLLTAPLLGGGGGGSSTPTTSTVTASADGISGSSTTTIVPTGTAAASPSPVDGTPTTLSVLGGATTGVSYGWSVIDQPPGSTLPTFSANNSGAAQTTTATFYAAGDYTFQVDINTGQVTTQTVEVTVNQDLSSITVAPTIATLSENQQTSFSATGFDQFGAAMATPPAFSWVVTSGGGVIDQNGLYTSPGAGSAGPVTIAAESGAVSGSASVSVVNAAPTVAQPATPLASMVTGTSTSLTVLGADDGGESNLTYAWTAFGPAPVNFSANNSNAAQWVNATFSQAGSYTFTATISDVEGLSVTSSTTVTVEQSVASFTLSPSSPTVAENSQQQFTATVIDQFGLPITSPAPTWSLTEGGGVMTAGGVYTAPALPGTAVIAAAVDGAVAQTRITIPAEPPTVTSAANAFANPVTGTSTLLSVLGNDQTGETDLLYTWSATGPAAVTYSDNGINTAKNVTATFTAPGAYSFLVTITDPYGLSTTSSESVNVTQTLSGITVVPASASISRGQSLSFSAAGYDQFGGALATQPAFTWSIGNGIGSLNAAGVYTAPDAGNGNVTVTATTGGFTSSSAIHLNNELSAVVPAAQTTPANTPVIFAAANAIAIADGDPQSIEVPAKLTLSATHGALTLSQSAGLSFSAGTGTGDSTVTVTGELADLNADLSGLTFVPQRDFHGNGAVTVTLDETGTQISPQYTIPIQVQSPAPTPPTPTPIPTPNNPQPPRGLTPVAPTGNTLIPAGGGSAPVVTPTNGSGNSTPSGSSAGQAATTTSTAGGSTASPPVAVIAPHLGGAASPGGESNAPASLLPHQVTLAIDSLGSGEKTQAVETPIATSSSTVQGPTFSAVVQPVEQESQTDSGAFSAVLPSVLDMRVDAQPDQVFSFLAPGSRMSREMRDLDDQTVSQPMKMGKIVVGSATCVSMGASAAYFIWLMRGGSLLSSMISTIPTWNTIDPLPVLDNFESRKRRKARIASDGESLESLIDNQAAATQRSLAAPASSSNAGEEDA